MSIVVGMMFPNGGVVMYADKRSVTDFGNRTVTSDNYQKVHMISETIICGITGWAEWCLSLVTSLKSLRLTSASEMIGFVKSFPFPSFYNDFGSTITLGGIYDDGKPFLWTYTTSGTTTFQQDEIGYSVATNPESLGTICAEFLQTEFSKIPNPHQVLQNVIKFAAAKNPKYISPQYDIAVVSFRLKV